MGVFKVWDPVYGLQHLMVSNWLSFRILVRIWIRLFSSRLIFCQQIDSVFGVNQTLNSLKITNVLIGSMFETKFLGHSFFPFSLLKITLVWIICVDHVVCKSVCIYDRYSGQSGIQSCLMQSWIKMQIPMFCRNSRRDICVTSMQYMRNLYAKYAKLFCNDVF